MFCQNQCFYLDHSLNLILRNLYLGFPTMQLQLRIYTTFCACRSILEKSLHPLFGA
jgi:hypothetical protein